MKTVFVLVGDYWHSAESIKPMVDLLFDNNEWNVIYTERPEDVYTLEEKPELVISFKDPIENDQIPTDVWCDDKWNKTLFDLVENQGVGLILAHAAVTDLDINHVMITKMIQSMFVTHPQQCPMELLKISEHPVMEGVSDFAFPDFDEQYQMQMLENSSAQILANTKTEHGLQPAIWVSELGDGKICCITPAHTTNNLTCPEFVKIMQNAVDWCSK